MAALARLTRVLAGKTRWSALLSTAAKDRLTARRTLVKRSVVAMKEEAVFEYEVTSLSGTIAPNQTNILQLIHQSASRWGHRVALECGISGQQITYASLLDSMERCGGALQKGIGGAERGVGVGDVVSILMTNSPDFGVVFYGIMGTGAAPSPINPTFTPGEVSRQVKDCGSRMLVVESSLEPLAMTALALLQDPPFLYVMGKSKEGRPDLSAIVQDKNTPFTTDPQVTLDNTNVILYSSGTTGFPKGVRITYESINGILPAVVHPDVYLDQPCTDEHQSTIMGLMPFFHCYGLSMIMYVGHTKGSKIVTLPRFQPHTFLKVIRTHPIQNLHLVPPLLNFLCMPFVTPADLTSLKGIICSSAPYPARLAHVLKEKAPNPVFFQELYGMTETMSSICMPKGQERIGSCGKLLAGVRAKVVDLDTYVALPPGYKGELWLKSPGNMKGYLNQNEATKDILRSDGWLRTGDVATYDQEGFFYIVDRIKELIKVKGNQVSPSEIERELLKHEAVADAGVVGVPDDKAGELPKAYVVKKADVSEEELQKFISTRLAKHKQLAGGIEFLEKLPKNPAGKLLRKVMRDRSAK